MVKDRTSFAACNLAEEQKQQIKTAKQAETKTLLFVDDEEDLVSIAKLKLSKLGYNIIGTTQSTKALEMIQQYPDEFDLVITDQAMPVLPGKELVMEILKVEPDMPIIMCTGYSDMVNKPEAQALGIQQFLSKPYKLSELTDLIRTVLDNSTKVVKESTLTMEY